mmetsp:Transcript_82788/g.229858  ORF Transcript_82788/g.229858 Transcript_82788/m.229858 type:complete len:797 (+) Transcript_82788:80-2470(+)
MSWWQSPRPVKQRPLGALCVVAATLAPLACCWATSTYQAAADIVDGGSHKGAAPPLLSGKAIELEDCAALLQVGLLVQRFEAAAEGSGRPKEGEAPSWAEASGGDGDVLVGAATAAGLERLFEADRWSRGRPVPWFYSPALDAAPFGFTVPDLRVPFWLAEFQRQDLEELHSMEAHDRGEMLGRLDGASHDRHNWGRIFRKVPDDNDGDQFNLQTIFGRYLAVNADGTFTADHTNPENASAKFKFVKHPYTDGRICIQTNRSLCMAVLSIPPVGQLVEVDPALLPMSTSLHVVNITSRGAEYMMLQGVDGGWVTADLDRLVTAQWRRSQYPLFEYEIAQHLAAFGLAKEKEGFRSGVVAGIVVGGLLFLAAYNLCIALTDTAVASAARLPTFDVARFVLEVLVVHAHLDFFGLAANKSYMYMSAFRMPTFIFIAGIFGSSMAYESIAKMLCCTVGTTTLMVLVRFVEWLLISGPGMVAENVGVNFDIQKGGPGLWFLMAVFFLRLTVTPIFVVARALGLRKVVPLLFVKVVAFFLMHWGYQWHLWIFGSYNWTNALAFAPYFALGLLQTPKEWDAIYKTRWVQAICVVYFVLWYLLILSPAFLQWNRFYCLPQRQIKGCRAHFDPDQLLAPVTAEAFLEDMVLHALRAGLALSFVGVVATACQALRPVLPQLVELAAGWGSRTLYTYVLHLHLATVLTQDAGVRSLTADLSQDTKLALALTLPVLVNVVFSSKGTEHWFRWLLLPYWMKDFWEKYVFDHPRLPARFAQLCSSSINTEPGPNKADIDPTSQQQGRAT